MIDFDHTRFFKDPATMTDDELEREYTALQRQETLEVFTSPDVRDSMKDELRRHALDVEREYKARRNEEWIYPLSSFGIVNF